MIHSGLSTLWPEESLASLSAPPGSDVAQQQMTATSVRLLLPSCRDDGPPGCFSRMVLATLQSANYQLEPRMGGELDGLADWMDRTGWPALPEESQHLWEPPRTVARKVPHHDARLEAIGNAIVPRQIFPFLSFLVPYERGGA